MGGGGVAVPAGKGDFYLLSRKITKFSFSLDKMQVILLMVQSFLVGIVLPNAIVIIAIFTINFVPLALLSIHFANNSEQHIHVHELSPTNQSLIRVDSLIELEKDKEVKKRKKKKGNVRAD